MALSRVKMCSHTKKQQSLYYIHSTIKHTNKKLQKKTQWMTYDQ